MNEKDKAFEYLEKSIVAGYQSADQVEHAKDDADFKNIKDDPRFDEMIAMMQNGGKRPDKKLSKKDLFGSWKVHMGMRAGSKVDASRLPTIEISEKSFTIPAGPDQKFVMSYKLDLDAKPIKVDFKIESGPVPTGEAKGIIKMEDGEMTLCYEPTGAKRPEKFNSTEANNHFMFKMKRNKAKGDKATREHEKSGWNREERWLENGNVLKGCELVKKSVRNVWLQSLPLTRN